MDGREYYKLFNLKPGATFKDLKKAYRNLVKIWHPDRLPKSSPRLQRKGEEKIMEITAAYERLKAQLAVRTLNPADFPGSEEIRKPANNSDVRSARFAANSRAQQGQPTILMPNGDKYIGEFTGGKAHGNGTFYFANGDKYVGEFKGNQRHGHGMYFHVNGNKYVGGFKNNKPQGQGIYYYSNGDKYVGEFVNDEMHGKGSYIYANGDQYAGDYQNGMPHGQGEYISAAGKKISGTWENGIFIR